MEQMLHGTGWNTIRTQCMLICGLAAGADFLVQLLYHLVQVVDLVADYTD